MRLGADPYGRDLTPVLEPLVSRPPCGRASSGLDDELAAHVPLGDLGQCLSCIGQRQHRDLRPAKGSGCDEGGEAFELLGAMLDIERRLGRRRAGVKGGPRTIDLDLLVYDDLQIAEPGLELPHPRLAERRFVLEPLADLDPALAVPGRGAVETLLAKLDSGP